MADGKQFEFLLSTWGVEASATAQAEITDNVESLNRKTIEEYIKDSDIRKLGLSSSLPKELARMGDGQLPVGRYLCQVSKFADVTQPTKFQEEGNQKWRLLALDLVDGEQKFKGIEYTYLKGVSPESWPGTKLLLHSTNQCPLYVRNSHLLLTPDTVEVLGGEVWKLMENWKASKEVENTRLAWKQDGIKKKVDGEGAPPWVDFDPKKAPRHRDANKAAEEERAEWRKAGDASKNVADAGEERQGTRFQVEEFKDADAPQVQSKVSASVFKQDFSKGGKGKGKDRDGEDGGKGKGKGKSRRRDDDDDGYQEEKRAPASTSLAAFIKPTKAGEMPDETVAAKFGAAPKPAKTAAADAGWAADDGWGDSGWGESAQAWSSSGAGWSSSGRGSGGKGKGKGGGGKGKGGGGGKGKGSRGGGGWSAGGW